MDLTQQFYEDAPVPFVTRFEDYAVAKSDFGDSLAIRIQSGDEGSLSALYQALCRKYRFYFGSQIGVEMAEDAIHELYLLTVEAVKLGHLQDPENLAAYVRGIARNQSFHYVADKIRRREVERPMDAAGEHGDFRFASNRFVLESERRDLIRSSLDQLAPRHREILERFYLREESPAQIQRAMNLRPQAYRLMKWRAKLAFGEIGRKHVRRAELHSSAARPSRPAA
jgi:RNA polymerase sigma factor (sigma-70 family)